MVARESRFGSTATRRSTKVRVKVSDQDRPLAQARALGSRFEISIASATVPSNSLKTSASRTSPTPPSAPTLSAPCASLFRSPLTLSPLGRKPPPPPRVPRPPTSYCYRPAAAMGVPKFFRWMSERYPGISQLIAENRIPEFDCLYVRRRAQHQVPG